MIAFFALVQLSLSQTGLSANSGINTSDTYAVFDMTVQAQSSQTFASYTASDNHTETWHVEAGYDTNGQQVINLYPTGTWAQQIPISAIRIAKDQLNVFDLSGNLLPLPNENIQQINPFLFQGSPSPSVVKGIVVQDLQTYSNSVNGSLKTTYYDCSAGSSCPTVTSMTVTSTTGVAGQTTYTYEQSGNVWLATSIDIAPTISNGNINRNISIANLIWNDNSTNDQARANSQTSGEPLPTPTSATPESLNSSVSQSCWTPSLNQPQTFSYGGSLNLVLQHGLWSNSSTWCTFEPILANDFLLGAVVLPSVDTSINTTQSITDDANTIQSDMDEYAPTNNNFVLIGHSMGGLMARKVAQSYQSSTNPQKVAGVVTLDTPNLGPYLLNASHQFSVNTGESLLAYLFDNLGCNSIDDSFPCFIFGAPYTYIPSMVSLGLSSSSPATEDMTPGSNFLTSLNGTAENFIRVGITGNSGT